MLHEMYERRHGRRRGRDTFIKVGDKEQKRQERVEEQIVGRPNHHRGLLRFIRPISLGERRLFFREPSGVL